MIYIEDNGRVKSNKSCFSFCLVKGDFSLRKKRRTKDTKHHHIRSWWCLFSVSSCFHMMMIILWPAVTWRIINYFGMPLEPGMGQMCMSPMNQTSQNIGSRSLIGLNMGSRLIRLRSFKESSWRSLLSSRFPWT